MAAAYRQQGTLPTHKPYTVWRANDGAFYINHTNMFGHRSGAGVCGEVMDAVQDLVVAKELGRAFKWVDDLNNTREPILTFESDGLYHFMYGHSIDDIKRELAPLGISWKDSKQQNHAFQSQYIGFRWDFWERRISIPIEKLKKYLDRIEFIISTVTKSTRIHLKYILQLHGCLTHVCYVIREGRARLVSMRRFMVSFNGDNFKPRIPGPGVRSELDWWKATLQSPNTTRKVVDHGAPVDLDIWVDASTSWGIGMLINGCYRAWKYLPHAIGVSGRDIGWAESVGIELCIRWLASRGKESEDHDFIVHGDNTGSIGQYDKGRGRNAWTNDTIKRSSPLTIGGGFDIVAVYVASASNKADPISRGEFGVHKRLPPTFSIPDELKQYLLEV